MSEQMLELWQMLPPNLAAHLKITVIALLIGVFVSLPLAIYVERHAKLRYPVLTAVSIVQTIPSLALLALMYPVFLGLSMLTLRAAGFEVSPLGFYPTVVALTLYSMLPIVRNTVTGIAGVEPAMIEAARGVGMTERQVLWKVQLPLAAPVIIAGVRTATVWVVGIATLATPIGQRCLGNFIFRGLQTKNWTMVLFGCAAAALLAILLDLLIGGLERAVKTRSRGLGFTSGIALLAIVGGGMIAPAVVDWTSRDSTSASADAPVIWVGSKTFTEQYILADVISEIVEDAGFRVEVREGLGSAVVFDALADGEIDVYVDYTGTIWANYMKMDETAPADEVMQQISDWARDEHGIVALGMLGFENAYGLAMRRSHAEQLDVQSIDDLSDHARTMKIGGDYEFFGRPEWRAIRDRYDLRFDDQVSYDSTFMYEAVAGGEVDVISAFTSDGRIAANDLAVLDDPRNAIPPYDAVLLISEHAAQHDALVQALQQLIDAIDLNTMQHANKIVDIDGRSVSRAARWLGEQVLQDEQQAPQQ